MSSTNIEFNKENKGDPRFKVGDDARISKYTSIFAKCYNQNWSEKLLLLQKLKIYCSVKVYC